MKKTLIKSIFMTSLIFNLINCDDSSGGGSSSSGSNILFNQKIIENDDFFTNSHWNDPHVLYVGGQFIMYASSDSYVSNWDGYVRIFRLVSNDGKTWTLTNGGDPVISLGTGGQWDEHCTETPAVVYFNGQYHMFYTGYDVAYDYTAADGNGAGDGDTAYDDDTASKHFAIGHAVSNDGISWTKDGANPIVTPTDPYVAPNLDFNQSVVGEPAPVVFNNRIYLYFTAVGAATDPGVGATWQTIGLIKSGVNDASTWSTPQRALTPDISQYPRNSGDEYIGFSTPNAVVYNNQMHLFVDVVLNSPWKQVKIHHAVSADGETGWTHDSEPLLEREDYSWTAEEIRSPSALVYNNNFYLYFAGHQSQTNPNLCIGLIIYDNF